MHVSVMKRLSHLPPGYSRNHTKISLLFLINKGKNEKPSREDLRRYRHQQGLLLLLLKEKSKSKEMEWERNNEATTFECLIDRKGQAKGLALLGFR